MEESWATAVSSGAWGWSDRSGPLEGDSSGWQRAGT